MQTFETNCSVIVDSANSESSNKKSVIYVLHVDDDPTILEISKIILLEMGNFAIDHADSVDEAFKKLATGQYDVVISDYEMPQKNGLQFLKELREAKNGIPFILFTGKGREEVAIKALNLGADGYYNKQGNPETVYGELAHGIKLNAERKKATQTLKKQAALIDLSPDAIIIKNMDETITFWNAGAEKLYGYTKEEALGQKINILLRTKNSKSFEEVISQLKQGKSWTGEITNYTKNNNEVTVQSYWSATLDAQGGITEILESNVDITKRKHAEENLCQSEEKYRDLFDSTPDGIVISNSQGVVESANQAAATMFGYIKAEDLVNVPAEAFYADPQDRRFLFELMAKKVTIKDYEVKLKRKDGTTFDARITLTLLKDLQDNILRSEAILRDITERKKTENALRESMEKNQVYLEKAPLAFFVSSRDGKAEFANKAACDLLGYTKEEFLRISFADVLLKEDLSQALELFIAFKDKDNGVAVREFRLKRKNGQIVNVVLSAARLSDGKLITFCQDITDRKKTEETLRKSEEEYSSLFANMIDGFAYCKMVFDEAGKPVDFVYLQVNDAFERITGLKRDLIIGKKASEVIPGIKEDNPELFEIYGRVALTGQKDKDEHFQKYLNLWLNVSVYSPAKGYFAAILEDITERKKVEQSLRENEAKFRTLAEHSPNMIFINHRGRVVYANKKCEEITGYSREELYCPDFNFLSLNAPEYAETVKLSYAKHMKGETVPPYEYVLVTRDGKRIKAIINTSLIEYKGDKAILGIITDITEHKKAEEEIKFQADLLNRVGQAILMVDNNQIIRFWNNGAEKLYGWTKEQALGRNVAEFLGGGLPDGVDIVKEKLMAGETWSAEFSAKKRDGSFVPIILNRTPIFNEKGVFVGAASIATDISSQKSTEADLKFSLESLSNSLDKIADLNEKLRVVGSLTRHDVRNKLSTVTAYAYLLKKRHSDQLDIVEGLGKMEQAVKQTSRIFDFAKMYEQIGEEELTYVDAEEKLKEAVALFSEPIPTVKNECHGSKVLADSFLRQMFFNFIDNTIKYGKKTKTIRVHFERADQESIKLIYEDDGVGVPSENKPRLFSGVFSTGGSTGFGLFLIKKMMDVYGWQIQENGTPGEGAKFTITIPKLNKSGKENYQFTQ